MAAALLARRSLSALRSRQLVAAGQTLQGVNGHEIRHGTCSFSTKQSFSTDKDDEERESFQGRLPKIGVLYLSEASTLYFSLNWFGV